VKRRLENARGGLARPMPAASTGTGGPARFFTQERSLGSRRFHGSLRAADRLVLETRAPVVPGILRPEVVRVHEQVAEPCEEVDDPVEAQDILEQGAVDPGTLRVLLVDVVIPASGELLGAGRAGWRGGRGGLGQPTG
jgi:hypothetical protein